MRYFATLHSGIADDNPLMLAPFVWECRVFDSVEDLQSKIKTYRELNPNGIVGCCRSALYFRAREVDTTQPKSFSADNVPDDWKLRDVEGNLMTYPGHDDQHIYDYGNPAARARFVLEAVQTASEFGMDAICWDNCRYNIRSGDLTVPPVTSTIGYRETTVHFIEFFKFCRQAADAYGLKVFANVTPSASISIPDAIDAFIPFLDGIMFEGAFSPKVQRDPGLCMRERIGYLTALDQGKMVALFPYTNDCLPFLANYMWQEFIDFPDKFLICNKGTFQADSGWMVDK